MTWIRIFRVGQDGAVSTVVDAIGTGDAAGGMRQADQVDAVFVDAESDAATQHDVFADLLKPK